MNMYEYINKRYLVLVIVSLLLCTNAVAKSPVLFPGSDKAAVGILIKDLKTGEVIASHNHSKLFTPASTMKLVTVASAVRKYPVDSRYETNVGLYGNYSADSLFTGVVVITPTGDPSVNSRKICENDDFIDFIVKLLKNKGIRYFKGEIIVRGESIPQQGQLPTWEIEDASYGYGAGWFAFNFNDNVVRYNTNTGDTFPDAPFLSFDIHPSDSPFEIVHGVDSDEYSLYGKIPGRIITLPLPWPATLFTEQLISSLDDAGIIYEGKCFDDLAKLPLMESVVWSSPERSVIYRWLMKHSDNTMAEATLRSLASGESRDSALVVEREILTDLGVDLDGMRIFDGSGLTRKNAVSPEFLVEILAKMAKTKDAVEYASYFPVAGKDGTMRSFCFRSKRGNKLALKTGTINGVRCYAGYMLDRSGKPLCAIAIMVNHINCDAGDVRIAVEKYFDKTLKQYK